MRGGLALPLGEFAQHRAEQLQLLDVVLLLLKRPLLDLGKHLVDVVGFSGKLGEAFLPLPDLGIVVRQAVDRLLEFHEAPDPQLVPVILGLGAIQVVERCLVLATVVQDVAEVDARFGMFGVELQRATQRRDGPLVIAEAMLGIADERDALCRFGGLAHGHLEILARVLDQPFAKEGATDLQHELQIVLVP